MQVSPFFIFPTKSSFFPQTSLPTASILHIIYPCNGHIWQPLCLASSLQYLLLSRIKRDSFLFNSFPISALKGSQFREEGRKEGRKEGKSVWIQICTVAYCGHSFKAFFLFNVIFLLFSFPFFIFFPSS